MSAYYLSLNIWYCMTGERRRLFDYHHQERDYV